MSGIPRILIVGAGLTGSAISSRLAGAPVSLTCWDKAKDFGGRMTSKTWRNQRVDIGPKFISRMIGEDEDALFKELINSNVIEPITHDIDQSHQSNTNTQPQENSKFAGAVSGHQEDLLEPVGHYGSVWLEGAGHQTVLIKPDNYTAGEGSQSIVNFLFKRSNVVPETDTFLHQLNSISFPNGLQKWVAVNSTRNLSETFDAVILTIPVPQFIGTSSKVGRPLGDYLTLLKRDNEVYENLERITYFSSFSLGLFYETSNKQLERLRKMRTKYFPNNQIIKYVSVESTDSRQTGNYGPLSVCVHSHRTWANSHVELTKDSARSLIYEEFRKLINQPDLPEPSHILCHKWRYSQTSNPYPGIPGAIPLIQDPLLIGAGDSFSVSNVGGCLKSARVTVDLLKDVFGF